MNRRETLKVLGAGALVAIPVAPATVRALAPEPVCDLPPALVAGPASEAIPPAIDPVERARRAWAEFSAAMDEITQGANGWFLLGAGHRRPYPGLRDADSRWMTAMRIDLVPSAEPLHPALRNPPPGGVVERHDVLRELYPRAY